jgi:hypothetical protein
MKFIKLRQDYDHRINHGMSRGGDHLLLGRWLSYCCIESIVFIKIQ